MARDLGSHFRGVDFCLSSKHNSVETLYRRTTWSGVELLALSVQTALGGITKVAPVRDGGV